MKIAAVCVTYNRPKQLGQMIRCFERQSYPDRELVILDDAGQYQRTEGDRWRLITTPHRFSPLGMKRNVAVDLVSRDTDAIAVWDDDDVYFSWALEATVAALQLAPLSRPSLVLHPTDDGNLQPHATGGMFHSGWGYHKEWFWRAGGYPPMNCGEDRRLLERFVEMGTVSADPVKLGYPPFLIYRWKNPETPHLCQGGRLPVMPVVPTDILDWIADPPFDLDLPPLLPCVQPRVFDADMKRFPPLGTYV